MKLFVTFFGIFSVRSIIIILLVFKINMASSLAETINSIGYFVTNESCCGKDSDPQAVHGIETLNGGIVLSGKYMDLGNSHDGFVLKFPAIGKEKGNTWILPTEKISYDWIYKFGTLGEEDAANSAAVIGDFVFVAGAITNTEGILERYLAKLSLLSGELLWQKSFASPKKNRDSAIESVQITNENGLILTGVVNANRGTIEGFKSYGNPTDGNIFMMYFEEQQLLENFAPTGPMWEVSNENALTGKTIKQDIEDQSYLIASSTREEPFITKVIKIDQSGNIIWSKNYPNHGEITDIAISTINGRVDGYLFSGHRSDDDIGIDGAITKISKDGDILWSYINGSQVGGRNNFATMGKSNKNFNYEECWGIQSLDDGGAIMACGTGTHCEEFKKDRRIYEQCIKDPGQTWMGLLIRVDQNGELKWQMADSFIEDNMTIPTASEYIIYTKNRKLISVLDLSFGFGVQLLEFN